jgi:hypothetical protein
MTQLYRVLYCSRNLIPGSSEAMAADIRSILAASHRNNARDGITGGLLFSEGCFAQVLEGPLDAVESAFERIQCDERHSDVTVLQSRPIATRDFPEWSMAFAGPGAASYPVAGTRMADAFAAQSDDGDKLLDMLKAVIVRESEWLAPMPELATASS